MADIFISYSRKDGETAQHLAGVLEAEGWSVFWDRTIPPGRKFDEFIDEQLHAARCIVALWSAAANRSDWVLEEAEEGRARGILVPALIEAVAPPRGFRRIEAADLIGWTGASDAEGYRQLVAAIAAMVPVPPARTAPAPAEAPTADDILEHHGVVPAEPPEPSEAPQGSKPLDAPAVPASEAKQSSSSLAQHGPAGDGGRDHPAAPGRPGAALWPPAARLRKAKTEWAADAPPRTMTPSWLRWLLVVALALVVVTAAFVLWPPERDPAPLETFKDCDVCPEMVVIPAGTFMMGSPADEPGRFDDEGPEHKVTIDRFAIGRDEVTFEQWDACVEAGACDGYRPADEGWGRGSRPVINVSWADAQAYLAWLSEKTGEDYRLPTEAEWEYAARAGTETPYAFGETFAADQANCDTTVGKTTEVGRYPANAWGLRDMHGNVREWVEDVRHGSYDGAPADGSAWTDGEGKNSSRNRVHRGGSWNYIPRNCRSAYRGRSLPDFRYSNLGFRVARTLP